MREDTEEGGAELVVGGGCRVEGRCIIPVVRMSLMHHGIAAMGNITPVALIIAEEEHEYLVFLPGAPDRDEDVLETLRPDIEREKERCAGEKARHS